MDAKTAYAITRGAQHPMELPHWDDLTPTLRHAFERVFGQGMDKRIAMLEAILARIDNALVGSYGEIETMPEKHARKILRQIATEAHPRNWSK